MPLIYLQCFNLNNVDYRFFLMRYVLIFSGVLLGGKLMDFIFIYTRYKVNPLSWSDCKFTYFSWYFFHHYSSALLVMMSIEKCIVVYFPPKTKNICTVKTAKWACLVTAIVYAAFKSQYFLIIEAEEQYSVYTGVSTGYILTYYRIDSVLYLFAPIAIMSLTNMSIIYKFTKAKMALKLGIESTNQALSKSAMRGTAILITVSLTFIILTGLVSVVYTITADPYPVLSAILYSCSSLNHGINAVMYCIVGSRFRQELINFICCGKRNISVRGSKYITRTESTSVTGTGTIDGTGNESSRQMTLSTISTN